MPQYDFFKCSLMQCDSKIKETLENKKVKLGKWSISSIALTIQLSILTSSRDQRALRGYIYLFSIFVFRYYLKYLCFTALPACIQTRILLSCYLALNIKQFNPASFLKNSFGLYFLHGTFLSLSFR